MSFTSLMMLTTRQVVADEVSTSMVFQLQLPRIFLQLAYLVSRREGRAFASYAQIEGRGLLLLQQQQKAPFDSISNSTFTVLVLPFIFLPCILTIKQTQRATLISRCFSDRKLDIKQKMKKKNLKFEMCFFSLVGMESCNCYTLPQQQALLSHSTFLILQLPYSRWAMNKAAKAVAGKPARTF